MITAIEIFLKRLHSPKTAAISAPNGLPPVIAPRHSATLNIYDHAKPVLGDASNNRRETRACTCPGGDQGRSRSPFGKPPDTAAVSGAVPCIPCADVIVVEEDHEGVQAKFIRSRSPSR